MVYLCARSLYTPTHPLTNTLTHPHADRLLEASIFLSVQSNDHVASLLDSSEHFKREKRALQKKRTPPYTCVASGLKKYNIVFFFLNPPLFCFIIDVFILAEKLPRQSVQTRTMCPNTRLSELKSPCCCSTSVIIKLTVQLVNFIFHPNI